MTQQQNGFWSTLGGPLDVENLEDYRNRFVDLWVADALGLQTPFVESVEAVGLDYRRP